MMKRKSFDKTYVFVVILFLVAGIVSWNLYFKEYRQRDTVDIHLFPKEIDGWTSEELMISKAEYAILETNNAFVRKYTSREGESLYLMMVYSQHNRKVSHPPEVCYVGSGATILSNKSKQLKTDSENRIIRANRLLIEKGDTEQVMYYWFKVGDTFTPNYWRQQILIASKTILGKPASSALIRMSVTVDEEGEGKADRIVKKFTRLITPLLFRHLP